MRPSLSLTSPIVGLSCALLVCACEPPAGPAPTPATGATSSSVVYGEDDRRDVYELESELWRSRAVSSTVALISWDAIDASDPDQVQLRGPTLGQAWRLCEGERYADQPAIADCSGTLIGDDLILTAGHCVTGQASCETTAFVFDYHFDAPGSLADITADDVYSCRQLITTYDDGRADYSIVQIDRPVVGRQPAPVRLEDGPMPLGDLVTLIGFPSGLPTKIDANGLVVLDNAGALDFFEAAVDAFGGNSGSGVYDAEGNVVGVLVRGAEDYTRDGRCFRVAQLPEEGRNGRGEGITYVARALEDLCGRGLDYPDLCGAGGRMWCGVCDVDEDCAPGWRCGRAPENPDVSWCAPPCMGDADCRADHTCQPFAEGNLCTPSRALACQPFEDDGAAVWSVNACGRAISPVEICSGGTRCEAGACAEPPPGDVCEGAERIPPISQVIAGTLDGYGNDAHGACAGAGPERVFTFTLEAPSSLLALADGSDPVLYLRRGCEENAPEIACNDDRRRGDTRAELSVDLSPGTYHLFMDAWDDFGGPFELELTFGPTCEDACALDDRRCAGEQTQQICVPGPEGCSIWADFRCGAGFACADGLCAPACDPECSPGERACVDERAVVGCEVIDGCGRWGIPVECRPGRVCLDDFCQLAPEPDAGVQPPPLPDEGVPAPDDGVAPDGGPALDGDLPPDAAPRPDGGLGGSPGEALAPISGRRTMRGGRGCDATGGAPTGGLSLLLLGLLALRRRR